MKKKKKKPNGYENFFSDTFCTKEIITYSDCQNVTTVSQEEQFEKEPIFEIGYNTDKKKNIFSYLEKRITNRFVIPECEELGIEGFLTHFHPNIRVEVTDIFQLSRVDKLLLLKRDRRENIKHSLDEKEVDAALETQIGKFYDTTFDKVYWIRIFENKRIIFETEAGNLIKKKNHMAVYSPKRYPRKHRYLCDLSLLFAAITIWSEIRKFLDKYREKDEEERENNIPYRKYLQGRDELFSAKEKSISLTEAYSDVVINDLKDMLSTDISDTGNVLSFQQILDLYLTHARELPLSLFLSENYKAPMRKKFSQLSDFFLLLADDYLEEKEDSKYEAATARTYAKSFQDKVVATRSLKREMNLTKLNRNFGKVEFDAMVDMHQVRKIETEYDRLNQKVFKEPRLSEYSLRFRRLGCHKAAGLYYPLYKCMCIDVEYSDSFCHEFLHLIDYKNGKLSKKWDFRKVYECYVALLEKKVNTDTSLKKLKNSNRKYNLTYFKRSTEVFARCGEIYLSRILGINSILLNTERNEFAYPHDTKLERLIKEYFDDLFNMKREENENVRYHRKSHSSETTELLFGEKIRC